MQTLRTGSAWTATTRRSQSTCSRAPRLLAWQRRMTRCLGDRRAQGFRTSFHTPAILFWCWVVVHISHMLSTSLLRSYQMQQACWQTELYLLVDILLVTRAVTAHVYMEKWLLRQICSTQTARLAGQACSSPCRVDAGLHDVQDYIDGHTVMGGSAHSQVRRASSAVGWTLTSARAPALRGGGGAPAAPQRCPGRCALAAALLACARATSPAPWPSAAQPVRATAPQRMHCVAPGPRQLHDQSSAGSGCAAQTLAAGSLLAHPGEGLFGGTCVQEGQPRAPGKEVLRRLAHLLPQLHARPQLT